MELRGIFSTATLAAALTYTCYHQAIFPKLPTLPIIVIELVILTVCEFGPLSTFASRKVCHCLSGILMLHLDPSEPLARWFVYSVAISSLLMVWDLTPLGFKFRYARYRDVGMSLYLVMVVVFFYTETPLEIINPVFFADPAGAVVGKYLSQSGYKNPAWWGEKTVGGSAAVFITTLVTLTEGTGVEKLGLSALVTLAEGFGKDYDNLFIAAVVILGHAFVVS